MRLLLDAGVKTSGAGRRYYPAITPDELAATDAIVITHAHEDHVAALGWCIAQRISRRIFMTARRRRDATRVWRGVRTAPSSWRRGGAPHRRRSSPARRCDTGPAAHRHRTIRGTSPAASGASGGRRVRLGYCGDVVPDSPVFAMDPMPPATRSRSTHRMPTTTSRSTARRGHLRWVARIPAASLPTPLAGRSLELFAILGAARARAEMRDALRRRSRTRRWLRAVDGAAALTGEARARRATGAMASASRRAAAVPRRHGHDRPVARDPRSARGRDHGRRSSPAITPAGPGAPRCAAEGARRLDADCRRIRPVGEAGARRAPAAPASCSVIRRKRRGSMRSPRICPCCGPTRAPATHWKYDHGAEKSCGRAGIGRGAVEARSGGDRRARQRHPRLRPPRPGRAAESCGKRDQETPRGPLHGARRDQGPYRDEKSRDGIWLSRFMPAMFPRGRRLRAAITRRRRDHHRKNRHHRIRASDAGPDAQSA